MSNFDFNCPKCAYKGNNKELKCSNCDGVLELFDTTSGQKVMQCTNCGLNEMGSCPNCEALIGWKGLKVTYWFTPYLSIITYGFIAFFAYHIIKDNLFK